MAKSYWLAPELVNKIGGERRVNGQMSLGYLLGLAEQVQSEVAPLLKQEVDIPSLGISAQVNLSREADRTEFLEELQAAVQKIAKKYGSMEKEQDDAGGDENFRFFLPATHKLVMFNRR